MEDAAMFITDVGVLSKAERAPLEYTVVSSLASCLSVCLFKSVCCPTPFQIENTLDGKKANFPEGICGHTTRYICYTKNSASSQRVSVQ